MSAVADAVERHKLTETTLGALAEYITSGSRDWSKYYADSGSMFIRTQDINQNRLSLEDVAHVQLPAKVEGKRSLVRQGDLLITITGANVGKVAVVEQELPEAYVSQSVCLVRLNDPSLAKFLQFQLIARRGEKSALEAMAYGLGRPVLNLENVRAAPVKIGPPKIRADIVAQIERQFSRLDDAVANLKRVKANLKRYKTAVLSSATTGEILPGAGPFGCIPLAELCGDELFVDGDWVESKDQDPAGDVRLVQLADVGYGEFRNKSARFLTRKKAGALGCTFLKAGDILVARMPDPLGRACIFPGDAKDCVTVVDVCILRPDLERVDRRWLMHAINAPQVRQQVAELEAGSTRKRISRKNLATVVVPLIPKPLQTEIAAEVDRRLSLAEAAEESVLENEAASFSLRHSILQEAFGRTGCA